MSFADWNEISKEICALIWNNEIKNKKSGEKERNEAISLMAFKYLLFGTSNSSEKINKFDFF